MGGFCELIFASVRGHEINEGFLVTGLLFPLTLPPTIPLWQVAVELLLVLSLVRKFLVGLERIFKSSSCGKSFPLFWLSVQLSGNAVWTAADGYTGATILGQAAEFGMQGVTHSWWNSF